LGGLGVSLETMGTGGEEYGRLGPFTGGGTTDLRVVWRRALRAFEAVLNNVVIVSCILL
jgi:hypothetical protein